MLTWLAPGKVLVTAPSLAEVPANSNSIDVEDGAKTKMRGHVTIKATTVNPKIVGVDVKP
jgi:hypothetical protein